MSTILVTALVKIHGDLDVACTCHLSHGPLCPKRIAANAVADYMKEPTTPVREDFGFSSRMLARNQALIRAVAEAMAFGPKRNLYEGITWHGLSDVIRRGFEEDAVAALSAVDAFKVGP